MAEPTPPEVRDRMREILERDEFLRRSNPISRFLERIGEWLDERFGAPGVEVDPSGSVWGGPLGSVFLWLAAIVLLVGLAFVVRAVVRGWRPRRRDDGPDVRVDVDDLRSPSEWASDADAREAAGEWKEAIRCRYRELVARLVEARVVSPLAGRTPGELRRDLAAAVPELAPTFDAASLLFELPWYADAPTGPDDNARFRALAAQVVDGVTSAGTRAADDDRVEVGA